MRSYRRDQEVTFCVFLFALVVGAAGSTLTSRLSTLNVLNRDYNRASEPASQFLSAHIPTMPEQHHSKAKGNGYNEGSPLYGKQQRGGQVSKPDAIQAQSSDPAGGVELPEAPQDVDHSDVPQVHHMYDPAKSPVSMTMRCIINLCIQYFILYAIFALVRFYQLLSSNDRETERSSRLLQTLDACQTTVNFAPMLCVLFLAVRLRAIQLTQGQTERYGLPQDWCQVGMAICTAAVFWQLILLLVTSCCTGQAPSTDYDGNLEHPRGGNKCCVYTVQFFRFLLMFCLYGGFTVVCLGLIFMRSPKEVYPDGAPPVSVTAQCVITLSVQYFFVYLILALLRTYNQIKGFSRTKASDLFQVAAYTVNFAPMLCILFVLARMRALQLDPETGKPQLWAEVCFWICTGSMNLQTFFVLVVPTLLGGQASPGTSEGDISFKFNSNLLKSMFFFIRCILFLCLYGGFAAILVSVCFIEHTHGSDYVPPISPAMQCVMIMCVMFFGVYFFLSMANIASGFKSSEEAPRPQSTLILVFESARGAVVLCPMLCVLFLGIRMRAMQITSNQGTPQGWAQDCMYACVYATLLQLLLSLVSPLFSGASAPASNMSLAPRPKGNTLSLVFEGLVLICMGIVYASVVGVMVAVFTMTAENANGRGSNIPVTANVDRNHVDTDLALAQLAWH